MEKIGQQFLGAQMVKEEIFTLKKPCDGRNVLYRGAL